MKRPVGKFTLSLTGKDSHTVNIDAGQGSFSIAPKSSGEKADAYIDADTPVLWHAFDELETPAGSNWPRFFTYMGNDTSFVAWSKNREIEDFRWILLAPASIDLTEAQIRCLIVINGDFPLRIKLNNSVLRRVSFQGNPQLLTLEEATAIKDISFYLSTEKKSNTPVSLPFFSALEAIERIEISIPVVGQPFDCASLLPYKHLKSVSFWGNICNTEALAQMPQLTSIAVRYCADMSGFPPLNTWANLNFCVFWNVEEETGKRLRQELKAILKERKLQHGSVSQLRKKVWFATEYNIPFTNWEGKKGKEAMKAYKATLKAIKKVKTEAEAKTLLVALIQVVNSLPDIETTEREDTAEAVFQLAASAPFAIDEDKVEQWFDTTRDF
ncbi:MAG: hypothetical protein Q3983_00930 [Capnocytophaga sp.]|nr:hypothetical protein [Capnocytophaga sp.]